MNVGFSDVVRFIRVDLGVTYDQFADMLGVAGNDAVLLEEGKAVLRPADFARIVCRLANLTGKDVSEIICAGIETYSALEDADAAFLQYYFAIPRQERAAFRERAVNLGL